ncbi:antiviral reverse transcriptase Drt3a [Microbacterium sp. NPDC055988]|uniref:antiviral reverse transcriptase Drt3a n=1 Tax=Microbacterium sp. NPDC055988 TaxID=3345671 RepID=UPI0035E2BF29
MARHLEYTAASFFRIATLEARRGHSDPGRMFASVSKIINELRTLHSIRKKTCAPLWKSNPELALTEYASFRPAIAEKQKAKRDALQAELSVLSDELSAILDESSFSWQLSAGAVVGTRQTYATTSDPLRYFAMKQLESNLRTAHGLSAPNRNRLIAQLKDALSGKLPRHILRVDIQAFYESIDHTRLMSHLREKRGLSRTSIDLIEQLLREWSNLTSRTVGIPTGVGVSAYLAEIYARQLDASIIGDHGVHFYGRYVDDIVIVARNSQDRDRVEILINESIAQLGLSLSSSKTQRIDPVPHAVPKKDPFDISTPIDFLGYALTKNGGAVRTEMSQRAIDRYLHRLDASFKRWGSTSFANAGHEGLLTDRVRFLTSNTKLANSKGRAVTGIYFNYPHLSPDSVSLADLDTALNQLVDTYRSMLPARVHDRLRRMSFVSGFNEKIFNRYNQHQLKRLVAVWRG